MAALLLPILVSAQMTDSVAFNGRDVNLDRALLTLRREFNVAIVYDSRALRQFRVSGDGTYQPLETLLEVWLEANGLAFERQGGAYVVLPARAAIDQREDPEFGVSLHGRVIDLATGEGLPFASILVANERSATISNEHGWFLMLDVPSDTSVITVSFIGYEPAQVRACDHPRGQPLEVPLLRRSAALPVVLVSTVKRPAVIETRSPSLITLDNALVFDLPNAGEPDPVRNLQLLPGVAGAMENSADIHIRGGAADENLVVFDGFTIYYLDHFYGLFSAFNANSIRSVRLHKGVFEPMHGGRASSVLEITARQGNLRSTRVKTDLSMLSASVHLETPILGNRASMMLSGRRSYTDVLFSPLYRSLFNNLYTNGTAGGAPIEGGTFGGGQEPDFSFYDLTTKISWQSAANDEFSLTFYTGRDRLNMQFSEQTRDNRFMFEYNDRSRWGNTGVGARWAKQYDPASYGVLTLGYSTFASELFGFDRRMNLFLGTQDTLFFDRDTEVRDLTMRYDFAHTRSGHTLRIGTANTAHRVENSRLDSEGTLERSIAAETTLAVYLQSECKAGPATTLTGGLRTSFYTGTQQFYNEPRLILKHMLSERITLHSGVGRTHQFIRNVRRQNLFLNTSDEWRLAGEGAVPVLRSDQVSAGVTLDLGQFRIDAEGYLRFSDGTVEDALRFIALDPGTFDGDLLTGVGRSQGVEFLLSKPSGAHTGWVAYTLSSAVNRFSELGNADVPAYFDRRHEVKAVYSFNPGRYRFSAVFVYGSGLPFTAATGVYDVALPTGETRPLVAFSSLNGRRLPDYHRLDLSATRSFIIGNGIARAGFSLYNVYGRNNVRDRYFFSSGSISETLLIDFSDIVFLGFVPSVNLSFEW